mgnify:CR=1 FL=1
MQSAIEIYAGYSYAGSEIPITVDFANKGTVTGGSYNAFSNCGTVTGGYAKILTNLVNGEINGGTFKKLKSNAGTINAAVFEQKDNLTSPNEITANGCLINKMISTKAIQLVNRLLRFRTQIRARKLRNGLLMARK